VNDERDGQGDDNVTPDEFAHLFRPDAGSPSPAPAPPNPNPLAPSPPNPSPASEADPPLPVSAPSEAASGEEAPQAPAAGEPLEASSAPAPAPDGSRLFRSRGAPERDDAITAVGSLQALRLKTMSRSGDPDTNRDLDDPAAHPPAGADDLLPAPPLPVASSGEPAPALAVMSAPAPAPSQQAAPDRPRRSARTEKPSSGSLTGLGVYAVTIGVTVILAFGETMFFGGELGLITGIGLVVVSLVSAFVVRTRDGLHAIFAPPIAFLVAALTAGQMGVTATDTPSRAVVVFFLLGNNSPWIIGATAASLVIVALRRRVG
jgi:hypothetical protein